MRDRAKVAIDRPLTGNRIRPHIRHFRWDKDHRPWMTLKATDNQYGRLS